MRIFLGALLPLCIVFMAGCGSSNGALGGVGARFDLIPQTATVRAGQTQTFQASVIELGFSDIAWSVDEGSAGGTITPGSGTSTSRLTAVYTAPQTPGTYHVRTKIGSGTPAEQSRVAVVRVNP